MNESRDVKEGIPSGCKVLTDVNILAIGLTDNHPAYDHVRPWIETALDGPNVLLIFDYYPLRTQYIMTHEFDVSPVDARNAVLSLIRSPARIVGTTDTELLDAYQISAEKGHDVYDCFLLALGRSRDADFLITTDTDFEDLCTGETITYRNPIPDGDLDLLSK